MCIEDILGRSVEEIIIGNITFYRNNIYRKTFPYIYNTYSEKKIKRNEPLHSWLRSSFQVPLLLQTTNGGSDFIYPFTHQWPHVVFISKVQLVYRCRWSFVDDWHFITEKSVNKHCFDLKWNQKIGKGKRFKGCSVKM